MKVISIFNKFLINFKKSIQILQVKIIEKWEIFSKHTIKIIVILLLTKHVTLKKTKISTILKRKAKWRYHISNTNVLCAVQYNRIIVHSIVLWNSAILSRLSLEKEFSKIVEFYQLSCSGKCLYIFWNNSPY